MERANNSTCVQCGSTVDTVEYNLLDFPYWNPFRTELAARVGHSLSVATIFAILCGPAEEDLPPDPVLRG
ncbi:Retrovirus-related Pol polyprotein from type-1 retrotransposable element R1 [Aphis craccivora]|uniref:Retrovirus-related Pol polyprotein from type-1 retrotransposable element R1 n=1 Tax=Aphis craccivora TaxID=307492 RepID=A0A6G0Y8G7_APHCR|nr:Retrovirus-related Pol polyprotein from type-1 retrotransposable element R1 [Aphis craccivora]